LKPDSCICSCRNFLAIRLLHRARAALRAMALRPRPFTPSASSWRMRPLQPRASARSRYSHRARLSAGAARRRGPECPWVGRAVIAESPCGPHALLEGVITAVVTAGFPTQICAPRRRPARIRGCRIPQTEYRCCSSDAERNANSQRNALEDEHAYRPNPSVSATVQMAAAAVPPRPRGRGMARVSVDGAGDCGSEKLRAEATRLRRPTRGRVVLRAARSF
jgi:hypothetical protein